MPSVFFNAVSRKQLKLLSLFQGLYVIQAGLSYKGWKDCNQSAHQLLCRGGNNPGHLTSLVPAASFNIEVMSPCSCMRV